MTFASVREERDRRPRHTDDVSMTPMRRYVLTLETKIVWFSHARLAEVLPFAAD